MEENKSFLRKYKGLTIYDMGQVADGDPGDHKISVQNSGNEELHFLRINLNNTENLNKGIERAKEWIDESGAIGIENVRSCRVCGCTQDNCQQCVEKTGSPCHWVEDDLCSACVEKTPEATSVVEAPVYNESAGFFENLGMHENIDMSIRVKGKNGKLTIGVIPGPPGTGMQPVLETLTGKELDEIFFQRIFPKYQNLKRILPDLRKKDDDDDDEKGGSNKPTASKTKTKSNPRVKAKAPSKKKTPEKKVKAKADTKPNHKVQKPKADKPKKESKSTPSIPTVQEQQLF